MHTRREILGLLGTTAAIGVVPALAVPSNDGVPAKGEGFKKVFRHDGRSWREIEWNDMRPGEKSSGTTCVPARGSCTSASSDMNFNQTNNNAGDVVNVNMPNPAAKRRRLLVYVGEYIHKPSHVVDTPSILACNHPRHFEDIIAHQHDTFLDFWTNNPFIVDCFAPEDVMVCSKEGVRPLSAYLLVQRIDSDAVVAAMSGWTSGKMWEQFGEDWVSLAMTEAAR